MRKAIKEGLSVDQAVARIAAIMNQEVVDAAPETEGK
jgi:hypothetical protein